MIIFLDLDGVINEAYNTRRKEEHPCGINYDNVLVENLNKLTKETNAKIVLSTSWRVIPNVEIYLYEIGIEADIIGKTLNSPIGREEQIKQYVDEHNIEKFIILDDWEINNSLHDYWINTINGGFNDSALQKALKLYKIIKQ